MVPLEVSWSFRKLWAAQLECWEPNSSPPEEQQVPSTTDSSSVIVITVLKKTKIPTTTILKHSICRKHSEWMEVINYQRTNDLHSLWAYLWVVWRTSCPSLIFLLCCSHGRHTMWTQGPLGAGLRALLDVLISFNNARGLVRMFQVRAAETRPCSQWLCSVQRLGSQKRVLVGMDLLAQGQCFCSQDHCDSLYQGRR